MRRAAAVAAAVAALALAAAGALGAATPAGATPAAATKPGYVAIVISGHGSGCVKWRSGSTGDAVLNAVATVHYRRDGIIDQIDGTPDPPHADSNHYWSYWHDTGSTWVYSTSGASGSTPAAGTVEGWAFDNGSSPAPPPSRAPKGLYAALCGSRDKPAPVATAPGSTPTTAGRPPSGQHGSSEVVGVARPRRSTSAGPTTNIRRPSSTARPTSASASASASRAARASATGGSRAATTGSAGAAPQQVAPADRPVAARRDGSAVLPVIVAGALILALATAAAVTAARRRADPAG